MATPYYIHSSNNHRFPPLRPDKYRLGVWIWELCYLAACYFWFTACCFLIAPKTHDQSGEVESLEEYIERIHLPRYYTEKYLLPLMSSVTTCTHDALLRFPATDILEYEKRTYGQPHFTVAGGVRQVEEKLSADIKTRDNLMSRAKPARDPPIRSVPHIDLFNLVPQASLIIAVVEILGVSRLRNFAIASSSAAFFCSMQ
ncbi:hypothetical protein BDW60DRAFT_191772 [Aspergillus nidulans var. acristatus]